jgi:hypothetical protein
VITCQCKRISDSKQSNFRSALFLVESGQSKQEADWRILNRHQMLLSPILGGTFHRSSVRLASINRFALQRKIQKIVTIFSIIETRIRSEGQIPFEKSVQLIGWRQRRRNCHRLDLIGRREIVGQIYEYLLKANIFSGPACGSHLGLAGHHSFRKSSCRP